MTCATTMQTVVGDARQHASTKSGGPTGRYRDQRGQQSECHEPKEQDPDAGRWCVEPQHQPDERHDRYEPRHEGASLERQPFVVTVHEGEEHPPRVPDRTVWTVT
jgi:hypothetical protein